MMRIRFGEALVWTLTPESAAQFFGLAPELASARVRVVKEAPETQRERERYVPEAKLYAVDTRQPQGTRAHSDRSGRGSARDDRG